MLSACRTFRVIAKRATILRKAQRHKEALTAVKDAGNKLLSAAGGSSAIIRDLVEVPTEGDTFG